MMRGGTRETVDSRESGEGDITLEVKGGNPNSKYASHPSVTPSDSTSVLISHYIGLWVRTKPTQQSRPYTTVISNTTDIQTVDSDCSKVIR